MPQVTSYRHADNIYLWGQQNPLMDAMDQPDLTTLGARISYVKELRGFSGAELARRAGCSQPTLWALEKNDTKEPAAWLIASVARALEISWEFILQGPDPAKGVDTALAESEILALFRELGGPARVSLLEFARHLRASQAHSLEAGVSPQQGDEDAYKRATSKARAAKKASKKSGT